MRPHDVKGRIIRRGAKANVFVADPLAELLASYYELLTRWNKKINLTSIENLDEAIDRLILEPLVAARHVPASAGSLMDVGSGGGSPAIPLKLALPRLRLTMVEAKARKSAFLREAVRHLGLENATVETARYEELLARPDLHEASDILSLRAVRIEARVLFSLQAFLASGGTVMLFRGPEGPSVPAALVPPLEWAATHQLVDSLQSRLTLLTKRQIG